MVLEIGHCATREIENYKQLQVNGLLKHVQAYSYLLILKTVNDKNKNFSTNLRLTGCSKVKDMLKIYPRLCKSEKLLFQLKSS